MLKKVNNITLIETRQIYSRVHYGRSIQVEVCVRFQVGFELVSDKQGIESHIRVHLTLKRSACGSRLKRISCEE